MRRGALACFGALLGDPGLHRLLQLLERPDLDLPDPLAGDVIFVRQIFERGRIVLQSPLYQDIPLPLVQRLQRPREQRLAAGQFLAFGDALSWLSVSSTSQSCHSPSLSWRTGAFRL